MSLSFKPWYKSARTAVRGARFGAFLSAGIATIEAQFALQPSVCDYAFQLSWFDRWSKIVGRYLNLEIQVEGQLIDGPSLLVSNHISWIDVVVLFINKPMSILAKEDVEDWPVFGPFTRRLDAVYISRTSKFEAYRSIPRLEEKLVQGGTAMVFPETTTTKGDQVLPFKPMFLEAAVRHGVPVQPVSIQYCDLAGNPLPDVSYSDGDTFTETLMRTLAVDKVIAKIRFLEPLDSKVMGRKEMAEEAHAVISRSLGLV